MELSQLSQEGCCFCGLALLCSPTNLLPYNLSSIPAHSPRPGTVKLLLFIEHFRPIPVPEHVLMMLPGYGGFAHLSQPGSFLVLNASFSAFILSHTILYYSVHFVHQCLNVSESSCLEQQLGVNLTWLRNV